MASEPASQRHPSAGSESSPPRRRDRLVLLAMASLVPILALFMASATGPTYLGINNDPEYAYLLNSLRVAEGHSPTHTDHPGTPLQVLGAGVIRVAHAGHPRGTMQDDVLLHSEFFIRAMEITLAALVAILSYFGGAMALRATGSVVAAALVQAAPLFLRRDGALMARFDPEPLIVGLGMLLGGCVLLVVMRGPTVRDRRAAVVMGAIIGIATATRMLFAPLGLVPLVALKDWRQRSVYVGSSVVFLGLSILPMAPQIPRVGRWIHDLATHTGRYGMGEEGVLDARAYPGALKQLLAHEPVYGALIVAGVAIPIGALVLRGARLDARRRHLCLVLFTIAAAQLALLLLVGKHPADHYLTAGAAVGGLSTVLAGAILASGIGLWARRAIDAAGILVLAGLVWFQGPSLQRNRDYYLKAAAMQGPVQSFLHAPGNENILHGPRISSIESALHFGNEWAGGRYTPALERLYPRAVHWDWNGITAFGRPIAGEQLNRVFRNGVLMAVVPEWLDPRSCKPANLDLETLKSFGVERLVRAEVPPSIPSGLADFTGFSTSTGLGRAEGPFPPSLPFRVRWGTAPETVLYFRSDAGPALLLIAARPNNRPGQSMEVSLNGEPVATHAFESRTFEPFTLRIRTRAGENEIRLRYAQSERAGDRDLCVLFRRLQIIPEVPAPGPGG